MSSVEPNVGLELTKLWNHDLNLNQELDTQPTEAHRYPSKCLFKQQWNKIRNQYWNEVGKTHNTGKLNSILWNNHWVKEDFKREIRNYLGERNIKKKSHNLWNTANAVLRGTYVTSAWCWCNSCKHLHERVRRSNV